MTYDLLIKDIGELATPQEIRAKGKEMEKIKILKDVDIGISEGKIERIGNLKNEKAKEILDAKGGLLLPGFVDSHTHLIFDGTREHELDLKLKGVPYLEILKRGGGILYTVKKTRLASKEKLMEKGRRILDKMLSFGSTTVEVKSGYGLDLETEIKILEVIKQLNEEHPVDLVPTYLGAHVVPPEFKNKKEEYIQFITDQVLPKIGEKRLAKYCDVFVEKNVFDIEDARTVLENGMKYGLMPKLHVDEIENIGGSRLASEVKAVSADHLIKTSEDEMRILAKNNVVANLLPGTSFMLMKEYAKAREMMKYNLVVALSTDFNPNCWILSMPVVMSLATYCMKMTPAEVLTASTINGAASICLDHKIGSITEGKQADLVLLELENFKQLPYMFAVNPVQAVVKRGEVVYKNNI
ncbi:MAG TPA: imidazolonepropionase [Thermoplasmata archaeon]|nr:imidazolonepropionase [Thermoplasmata archaeon]